MLKLYLQLNFFLIQYLYGFIEIPFFRHTNIINVSNIIWTT